MKRYLGIFMALALLLAGCGGGGDDDNAADTSDTTVAEDTIPNAAPLEDETTTTAAPETTLAPATTAADGSFQLNGKLEDSPFVVKAGVCESDYAKEATPVDIKDTAGKILATAPLSKGVVVDFNGKKACEHTFTARIPKLAEYGFEIAKDGDPVPYTYEELQAEDFAPVIDVTE